MRSQNIYNRLLDAGLFLLALSIPFSITLMNTGAVLLFTAAVIKFFRKETEFVGTGLEKYLVLFLAFYIVSGFLGPQPMKSLKDISDNYWYVIHMYLVVWLFGKKEMNRFVSILAWSAFVVSVYTLFQSFFGLNIHIVFGKMKMVAPELEPGAKLFGRMIYMGKGITGHHLTFGGQMLMLVFICFKTFRNRFLIIPVLGAFILSFAYSAWFGLIAALMVLLIVRKKKYLSAAVLVTIFMAFLFLVPGNRDRVTGKMRDRINIWKTSLRIYSMHPLWGVGAGQYTHIFDKKYSDKFPGIVTGARTHPHSIYLDMLTEGGVFTLLLFFIFLYRFYRMYGGHPPDPELIDFHLYSLLAVSGILFAGIFQTYLTDAENSVLIWTLMGFIIKTRLIGNEHN